MKKRIITIVCFFLGFNLMCLNAQTSELKVYTKLDAPFLLYINKKQITPEFTKESPVFYGNTDEVKVKIVFKNKVYKTIKRKILLRNIISERNLKVECQIAIGKRGKINLGRSVTQLY